MKLEKSKLVSVTVKLLECNVYFVSESIYCKTVKYDIKWELSYRL